MGPSVQVGVVVFVESEVSVGIKNRLYLASSRHGVTITHCLRGIVVLSWC
jgi:hypothetical protein